MHCYDGDATAKAMGAVLLRVESAHETEVKLHTDKGVLTLGAYGPCCSTSWFDSCEVEVGAVGGTITEVNIAGNGWTPTRPDPEPGTCRYPDSDLECYFPVIKTTGGRVLLELRNSSNGNYGGHVSASWAPAGQ